MLHRYAIRIGLGLLVVCCALTLAGCAGLPRIDSTGERVLVWPQDQPPMVAPFQGNLQAPPVYTDQVFPQPVLPTVPSTTATPFFPPTNAAPIIGTPQPVSGALPLVPQDTLSITPRQVLAPVGSEVVLKVGLCTRENYLLTNSQVNWMIARESAGEFVSLGGRGWLQSPLLPWNRPEKIDNQFARGYTAQVAHTITRGTADPRDDVQVRRGEAWASITSPVEGVSHVTAVAPEIVAWSQRRSMATIYWVDVQWTFPPPVVTAGGRQVLTTTVRRHTNGSPLANWLVRYIVADGGQAQQVTTDAAGHASIDVTPTGSKGTATRIAIQVIRPENYGGVDSAPIAVANGSTTIQWTEGGAPYLPPADNLDTPLPTTSAPVPGTPLPTQPPIAPPTTGQPRLELEIYGDQEAQVGGQTSFEIVIRNEGDGTATGIVITDSFDEGLTNLADTPGSHQIEQKLMRTLAPGESLSDSITFDVVRSGSLCHDVTVRCAEGSEAQKRACVNALAPVSQKRASFDVRKDGPRLRNVGETALFTLVIKNTGEVPLTNLEVVDEYDRALLARPTRKGYEIVNERIMWSIPRLEVGAFEQLDVQCQCVAPKQEACSTVQVSADSGTTAGVLSKSARHCIDIEPSRNGAPSTGEPAPGDVVPDRPPAETGLRMEMLPLFGRTVRAGTSATFQIVIHNNSTNSDQQVQLRVQFPVEMAPNVSAIRNDANVRATVLQNNELRFDPIAQIRPNERLEFVIPVNVNQQGVRNVVASLYRTNTPLGKQQTIEVEILGR